MKLIIANWKMNPASVSEAVTLAKATDYTNLVICPPFPFLNAVRDTLKNARLGAQNVFWDGAIGPYTGEISAAELKQLGVQYVIIGHSERRNNLGETDEMVAKKMLAAVAAGLTPILCVGENAEANASGAKETVLAEQIKKGMQELIAAGHSLKSICLAYEPIWAISTSPNAKADTPEDTVATILFFKTIFKELDPQYEVRFLYGGSVNAGNAEQFLTPREIEGALIGGASLKPDELQTIMTIAEKG